jgi:DNA-binding MarR family transcriptional regulator/N-acetylglutamate synthase-like GNAT family acetyltransferase
MSLLADSVTAVRAFNRFYTNVIGALREGLVHTPYSLTEGRVIFELAQREATEVADLRRTLDLDAGYLSRILARFEADGLVRRERSETDGRRQVIRLTPNGRAAYTTLDEGSAAEIAAMLHRLSDVDRRRLLGAMATIQELLGETTPPDMVVLRPPVAGDLGWVVQRHGALYADEYGWDDTFEALVARIVADYVASRDPKREAAWIAEVDGQPVGCVFCLRRDDRQAQLRLLLVEPGVRGMGIGGRLVAECVRFARRAGYEQLVLWTNDVLVDARHVYERAGFRLVEEGKHHSFGKDLVEQTWTLNLR